MAELHKTVVIKPTLSCNLSCKYCYEFRKDEHDRLNIRELSLDSCEKLITKAAQNLPNSYILWMFHGGEPLLCGYSFFESILVLLDDLNNKYDVTFRFAIQTNGVLLTDKIIQLFERFHYLFEERSVGISIDGDKHIHGLARTSLRGESHFNVVCENIARIRKSSLNFAIISTIGAHNVSLPEEYYKFLKEVHPNFLRLIPCYNFDHEGETVDLGIRPTEYADFVCRIFDLWLHDPSFSDVRKSLIIDPIATVIASLTGTFVTWCEYRHGKCDHFISVYPNGEIWLCDGFLEQDAVHAKIGHISECSDEFVTNIFQQPGSLCGYNYLEKKMDEECANCEIFQECFGGCFAKRLYIKQCSDKLWSEYCIGKKKIFNHVKKALVRCDVLI